MTKDVRRALLVARRMFAEGGDTTTTTVSPGGSFSSKGSNKSGQSTVAKPADKLPLQEPLPATTVNYQNLLPPNMGLLTPASAPGGGLPSIPGFPGGPSGFGSLVPASASLTQPFSGVSSPNLGAPTSSVSGFNPALAQATFNYAPSAAVPKLIEPTTNPFVPAGEADSTGAKGTYDPFAYYGTTAESGGTGGLGGDVGASSGMSAADVAGADYGGSPGGGAQGGGSDSEGESGGMYARGGHVGDTHAMDPRDLPGYADGGITRQKGEGYGDQITGASGQAGTQEGGLPFGGGIPGGEGFFPASGQAHLEGLPTRIKIPATGETVEAGHNPHIRRVAQEYMRSLGQPYIAPRQYVRVDPTRARRLAQEYERMEHNPHDPLVRAAYDAMINETMAQYRAAKAAGFHAEFWDPEKQPDPYGASPRLAIEDVNKNNHMFVFPTHFGFGNEPISEHAIRNNPLLADSGERWNGYKVTMNDIFRAVHDYFGHAKEGVGFRHDGEENAWRVHAGMYSPLARLALTSETRGQNSWLNFGPHGDANKNARVEDTIFADQKTGVMPPWTAHEGAEDFLPNEHRALIEHLHKRYGRQSGGLIQDKYPSHYMPGVGRQVMADGGDPGSDPLVQKAMDVAQQAQPAPVEGAMKIAKQPPTAYFEIAPGKTWDPKLQKSWEKLHPSAKAAVSNKMIGEFLSQWQRQTGIHGEVRPGLGGFEGDTNPNYTFHPYDPSHISKALRGLGVLFHQDAMMGAHAEPFEGSSPSGVVRIHLPEGVTAQSAHAIYKTLHKSGLAQGHSTDLTNRTMDILSGSDGHEAKNNAQLIDNALGRKYDVHAYHAHIAFPEHGTDYASVLPSGSQGSDPSLPQANPGLHDQAAQRLKALLAEAHRQGGGHKGEVDFGDTLAPGQIHPDVVSASMPTTVKAYKGPPRSGETREDISPSKHSRENYDNIATRMWAQHPASGGEMLPAVDAAKKLTDFHVKNLLALWDKTPVEQRQTSRYWYRAAHALGNALGDMHGIMPRAAHGIMAVLSPQNPWDTNVTQAERVMDILRHHQDTPWTKGMSFVADYGGANGKGLPESKGTKETGSHKWSDIKGKTLREVLSGPHGEIRGAMWLRAFDEAHNPSQFRSIAPTGEYGPTMMIPSGEKEAIASWNSYSPIQKAISIWHNPSLENINKQIGSNHKVREFYNVITNPHDPNGVVIDTHAVAAGQLLPHGSSAKAVHQNFGTTPSNIQKEALAARGDPWVDGIDPSKATGATGATGDYPFHAEAVRQAAWQRGVHPSEMQSVTWETVRNLFTNKSAPVQKAAKEIWQRYASGELDHNQAVDAIFNMAQKFHKNKPTEVGWISKAGSGIGNITPGRSYERPMSPITSEAEALPRYEMTKPKAFGGATRKPTTDPSSVLRALALSRSLMKGS